MKVRAFIEPHRMETMAECQDCYAINPGTAALAVSDGVSQSIFQQEWAKLLTDYYVRSGAPSEEDRVRLCGLWRNEVLSYIMREKEAGRNPWRAECMLNEGHSAGATLCGVVFWDDRTWTADVIGDSVLIVVEGDYTSAILSSEDKSFDTTPDYIDSLPGRKGRGEARSFEGALLPEESILLVTDPFSDYLYRNPDRRGELLRELLSVETHEGFRSLVERWRDEGMRDDDSTLVIIQWDGKAVLDIAHMDETSYSEENDKAD